MLVLEIDFHFDITKHDRVVLELESKVLMATGCVTVARSRLLSYIKLNPCFLNECLPVVTFIQHSEATAASHCSLNLLSWCNTCLVGANEDNLNGNASVSSISN